jgi:hypothetical protein
MAYAENRLVITGIIRKIVKLDVFSQKNQKDKFNLTKIDELDKK